MELYTFDREERYLISRGQDTLLTATWSRDDSAVTPTPGTVRVVRSGGAEVLAASAFTVSSDGVASYTLPAAATADLVLEEGWIVEWAGVGFPDGSTRSFVGEAALVRYVLAPPARLRDLYRRFARLDPTHPSPLVARMDQQDKLDEAWREIERRLYAQGRRTELVMSPTQFRIPHRELALTLIFEDLQTSSWEAYRDIAMQLRESFESIWSDLVFTYDADQDGLPDGGTTPVRESADAVIWLQANRSRGYFNNDDGYP